MVAHLVPPMHACCVAERTLTILASHHQMDLDFATHCIHEALGPFLYLISMS